MIISELSAIEQVKMIAPIENTIKELEGEYKKSVITVNGEELHLANFTKDGQPVLTVNKNKEVDPRVLKYRMSTLEQNNKKLRVIKDAVYSRLFANLFFAYRLSLLLAIVLGILAITLLIVFFVVLKYPISPLFISLAILFGINGLLALALRFVSMLILKKPRF